jgi:V8-like Glu-specific endopeptidase
MVLSIANAAFGCSIPIDARTGDARAEIIYGEDTRRDVYSEESDVLRRLALESSVAFMAAEHLVRDPAGNFAVVSETLGDANNLCPDEPFATQPAAAICSGVLVDDQLVLTAGHCVAADATCDHRLLVFDYAITDRDRAVTLDESAIYRCKSIALRGAGLDPSGGRYDYAFVELDRPVSAARRPVTLGPADPPPGSALVVIGYPSGLPVKIDAGAELLWMRQCRDYFTLDSDTFQSSSGSGVFDAIGRLVGIFVRGGGDYEYVAERDCAVSRRILNVADPAKAEHAGTVAPAVDALCASGWPSTRLCPRASDPARAVPSPEAGSCPTEPGEPPVAGGCTIGRLSQGSGPPTGAMIAMLLILRARSRCHHPRESRPPARTRGAVTTRLLRRAATARRRRCGAAPSRTARSARAG